MLDAGSWEGYCDYWVHKAFYNFHMDLPAALVNPDLDQWKIKAPQVGVRYPLVHILFPLSLSYLILFLMIEWMELVQLRHFLAKSHCTCKVAGCQGHAASPFICSWSSNRSLHTCTAYLAVPALFEPCTLALLHPQSLAKLLCAVHPHMVSPLTIWFLCYHLYWLSLFNYFLGCLQHAFQWGYLAQDCDICIYKSLYNTFLKLPASHTDGGWWAWMLRCSPGLGTFTWVSFSHIYNFSTVLHLSQEESHLNNYDLDPPTAQSQVLAPYTVDALSSLISIGDLHSIQVVRHAMD